jgi:hypothetical protein
VQAQLNAVRIGDDGVLQAKIDHGLDAFFQIILGGVFPCHDDGVFQGACGLFVQVLEIRDGGLYGFALLPHPSPIH